MIQFDTGWAKLQRHYREKIGLSQRDLAKRIGISASNINRYEQGVAQPGLPAVKLIVAVCKIPYEEVLKGVPAGVA